MRVETNTKFIVTRVRVLWDGDKRGRHTFFMSYQTSEPPRSVCQLILGESDFQMKLKGEVPFEPGEEDEFYRNWANQMQSIDSWISQCELKQAWNLKFIKATWKMQKECLIHQKSEQRPSFDSDNRVLSAAETRLASIENFVSVMKESYEYLSYENRSYSMHCADFLKRKYKHSKAWGLILCKGVTGTSPASKNGYRYPLYIRTQDLISHMTRRYIAKKNAKYGKDNFFISRESSKMRAGIDYFTDDEEMDDIQALCEDASLAG